MLFDDETDTITGTAESNGHAPARPDAGEALRRLGQECRDCLEGIKAWREAVFTDHVQADDAIDEAWKAKAEALARRAADAEGLEELAAELARKVASWRPAKRSVAPGPRLGWKLRLSKEELAEARRKLEAAPRLPADWEPYTDEQKARWRQLRGA